MNKSMLYHSRILSVALGLIFYGQALEAQQNSTSTNSTPLNATSSVKVPVSQAKSQQQLEIEQQRKQAEEEIKKNIIPDAVTVINETNNAISLINKGKNDEALAAIERATGKIDVLLARYPNIALFPVDFDVDVVDSAPLSLEKIKNIGSEVERAVKDKNYPDARFLLDDLQSEIDVETYSLPLAIYPLALRKAANLLQQRATSEAALTLQTALDSLIVVSQTLPIPIINAKALLIAAEEKYGNNNSNKDIISNLIEGARHELERARDLGYLSKDDNEYQSLREAIRDFQNQLNSNNTNPSAFRSLRNRLEALLRRHFDKKKTSTESQNNDIKDETPAIAK